MEQCFLPLESRPDYDRAVASFASAQQGPIPVFVGGRKDLAASVALSTALYDGLTRPEPADQGFLLSASPDPTLRALLAPLAREWSAPELLRAPDASGLKGRLLVVGLYSELDWELVRSLLLASQRRPELSVGFLSGRDLPSLLWMTAKQWARPRADVQEAAFLSSVDAPPAAPPVRTFSEADFDREDIQKIVLGQSWRQVLFQGHGKDDSINLGDFTICGRNAAIAPLVGTQFPRCGYGLPCYKDEAKLIPMNQVRAAEVVLSACNAGPIARMALYDPRYVLLLSAIDGCARTIVSAVGVHDSDYPENDRWMAHVRAGGEQATPLLNQSLRTQHPSPGFWHFGLPPSALGQLPENPKPSALVARSVERIQGYLMGELLPPPYPLRARLDKLNRKLNLSLSRARRHTALSDGGEWAQSLKADLQSLDYAMAERIQQAPEDDIMNYGSYFGERSEVDPATVRDIACSCGFPAQEFVRRGLVATVLSTSCVFCLRCGDKVFRMLGTPSLTCTAPDRIQVGEPLIVQARVDVEEDGPLQVGLFVPSYLRGDTTIEPSLTRLRGKAGGVEHLSFTLRFSREVAPQAYYFTLFAVQNLGLSTYRQHFGIERLEPTKRSE